jgi:hypothetical protein
LLSRGRFPGRSPGFGCGAIDCGSHPPQSRHCCPLCVARWPDRAAAEAEPDAPPDTVVLVSVGTVTSAQLKLLLGRIRSTFPRSQILVGYWDPAEQLKSHDVDGSIRYAESVSSLVDLVGRKAEEQTHDNDQPIVAGGLACRNLQVVAGIEHLH